MSNSLNPTHDPARKSWVDSANQADTDFPIQNLPFGVFRRIGADEEPRVGVAIGDRIVDVAALREEGLFKGTPFTAALSCDVPALNSLMALGSDYASTLRARLSELLAADGPTGDGERRVIERCSVRMSDANLEMPVHIGDYTDFYASVYHATNVGSMFRPDNPLLPNYKHVPIAYHGRASSIVVSGDTIQRPCGQTKADDAEAPTFGPSKLLDYELEVGFFVGAGSELGERIPIERAEHHIFGMCLVNDWSARDMQKWEYQPLGPFLAKSFATTISPWIVTLEALAPFRAPAFARPAGDPQPLPYLDDETNRAAGGVDITLEVAMTTPAMREQGTPPFLISRGNFTDMYWTIGQMLAHHASNGCNLRPGDLMASGTVSGQAPDSRGCLLERTWRGSEPLQLPTGEERKFLADGDEIVIRGYCERDGVVRIGFGECRGTIGPAS